MSTKNPYGCRVHLPDGDLLGFQERMAAAEFPRKMGRGRCSSGPGPSHRRDRRPVNPERMRGLAPTPVM